MGIDELLHVEQVYRHSMSGVLWSVQSVTVDVKLSHAGGAPATVLTAPVVINSASTARTVIAAAIAASPVADGDLLYVYVTVGGAGGTQAAGLLVSILVSENPVP